jgi:hypothetical protein
VVFIQKTASGVYSVCSHNIQLTAPASGSFTFTLGGSQVVLYMVLAIKTIGIRTTTILSADPNVAVNVYNVDGRLLLKNVIRSYYQDGLPNGIYIVDKQKVFINR